MREGGSLIVLCEGDMTFRAEDIEKLLAYIDHADIVNGTRIVEQLREYSTQLSTFMYYGNFVVGKLLGAEAPRTRDLHRRRHHLQARSAARVSRGCCRR